MEEEKQSGAAWPLHLGLALLLALQLALTALSFNSIDDLTNSDPVLNVDWTSQYYWAFAARKFNELDSRMWGYDPNFMAGYPLSFVFNSALPVQMAAVFFGSFNLARVIKAVYVISFALVPFTLYFSIRQFGIGRAASLAACALGVVYFWAAENAWFGHMGMISGAFMLHFYLVPLSLFIRFLRSRDNRGFTLLFFAFIIAFTIHKTAFTLVLPVGLVWFVYYSPTLAKREWGMILALFLFALLFNMHWLYPFFKYLGLKVEDPATTFFQNTDPFRVIADLLPIPPWQPFPGAAVARLLIVALGALGLWRAREEGTIPFSPLVFALAMLGAFSYFGSLAPSLRHLQPYRHSVAYFYLWLPAAAVGFSFLQKKLGGLDRSSVPTWLSPLTLIPAPARLAAPFALILGATLFVIPNFTLFARVAPLTTKMDKDCRAALQWIETRTADDSRILIEDINAWPGERGKTIYGGARFVQILPLLADRELIGGPLPNAFIKHHHAGFHDGLFLGRRIFEFSDEELGATLDLYNIGWVICWTDESKERFGSYGPAQKEDAGFSYLEAFRIEREPSFFLEGSGKVESRLGRIDLSELITKSGRVVVSYHWVEGLESDPPSRLVKVDLGGDPVGFIGVEDPPPKLSVGLLAR